MTPLQEVVSGNFNAADDLGRAASGNLAGTRGAIKGRCNPTPVAAAASTPSASPAIAAADEADEVDDEVAGVMRRAGDPDCEVAEIMVRAATRAARGWRDADVEVAGVLSGAGAGAGVGAGVGTGAGAGTVGAGAGAGAGSCAFESPARVREVARAMPLPRPMSGVATELCMREAEEGTMPSPHAGSPHAASPPPLVAPSQLAGMPRRSAPTLLPTPTPTRTRSQSRQSGLVRSSPGVRRLATDASPRRAQSGFVGSSPGVRRLAAQTPSPLTPRRAGAGVVHGVASVTPGAYQALHGRGRSPLLLRSSVAHIVD